MQEDLGLIAILQNNKKGFAGSYLGKNLVAVMLNDLQSRTLMNKNLPPAKHIDLVTLRIRSAH